MWRVVVARSDENSTLLSSEISTGGMGPAGHLSSLSGPPATHHWGYPPPPHHPSYQPPQHPDMRHHHDMRNPDPRHPNPSELRPELRHPDMQRPDMRHPDMQRTELRHPEMQRQDVRHPEMHRPELRHPEMQRHQDMTGMRPDLTELRPSHELPELKIDGAELRTQDAQQQAQQQAQAQGHQRNLKRAMSDSDCDDVFSEESGKEPLVFCKIY